MCELALSRLNSDQSEQGHVERSVILNEANHIDPLLQEDQVRPRSRHLRLNTVGQCDGLVERMPRMVPSRDSQGTSQ